MSPKPLATEEQAVCPHCTWSSPFSCFRRQIL